MEIVMIVRALLAVLGIGTLALSGAIVMGAADDDPLRRDVDDLKQRVIALEQRAARLEQARGADAQRTEQVRLALDALVGAAERLATGDPNVAAALDFAEGVLSPYSAWSIRAARAAVANKDLGLAQQHLLQAIAESRVP
jgi:hypothetical protein